MLPLPLTTSSLLALRDRAFQDLPAGWLPFCLDDLPLGLLSPARAAELQAHWPALRASPQGLHWPAAHRDVAARSDEIQAVARSLANAGAITGWRDEAYTCEVPAEGASVQRGAPLFHLERAAFRYLGLMSRAVHVNGMTPDGHMWVGRRALSKATDPGALDNLAAGGLPAGETPLTCARRELWEEAGVPPALSETLRPGGVLRSRRVEPEGLHDEVLHVYALRLPADFVPKNQDGEVSEFLLLDPAELAQRLRAGEFSHDAASVVAQGLLSEA